MLAMNCGDPSISVRTSRKVKEKATYVLGLLLGQNRVVRETLLAADAQRLRQAGLDETLVLLFLLLQVTELHVVVLILVLVLDVVLR